MGYRRGLLLFLIHYNLLEIIIFKSQIACASDIPVINITYNSTEAVLSKEKNDFPVIHLTLTPDQSVIVNIHPLCAIIISIIDISPKCSYFIFQSHAHQSNLTLSTQPLLSVHNHINGSDIGMVVETYGAIRNSVLYLFNFMTKQVSTLIQVPSYDSTHPVPGGCNMEFPLSVAPYLRLIESPSIIDVEFQLAAPPMFLSIFSQKCDTTELHYEVYHYFAKPGDYTKEGYFQAIQRMSDFQNITKYGKVVPYPAWNPKNRISFSTYPGVGMVSVVVVRKFDDLDSSAVYVPTFTYACGPNLGEECRPNISSILDYVCLAVLVIMGSIFAFFGHGCIKLSVIVVVLFGAIWLGAALLGLPPFIHGNDVFYLTMEYSLFGVGVFIIQCIILEPDSVMMLFWDALILGFFFASSLLSTTVGDFIFMKDDTNFWLTYSCAVLIIPATLLLVKGGGSIISCAIIGSMSIIIAADYYIGSYIKYFLINTIRRMTVKGFDHAILDMPFQDVECILVSIWGLLAVIGIVIQCWGKIRVLESIDVLPVNDERAPLIQRRNPGTHNYRTCNGSPNMRNPFDGSLSV